jgi:hypothetical protein
MSTLEEIRAVLPNLSIDDLYTIERSIHHLYRERDAQIVYDDSHGLWSEEDQSSAAAAAFAVMDASEEAGEHAEP